MSVHELKTWPQYFQAVVNWDKPYEIRRDDRPDGFHTGDLLVLREWQPDDLAPDGGFYTGRQVTRRVRHVLSDPAMGLREGFVALGLGASTRPSTADTTHPQPTNGEVR